MIKHITAILITLATEHFAQSAVIKHTFTGTVVEIDGRAEGTVRVGETVNGSFHYSTDLPDSDASIAFGEYSSIGDLTSTGFEFSFGDFRFTSDSNDLHRIAVSSPVGIFRSGFGYNWFFDADDNVANGRSEFQLSNSRQNYFGSDSLPTALILEDFSIRRIEFIYQDYYVRATIDSLQVVPEPSQVMLLCISGVYLGAGRHRYSHIAWNT